MRIRYLSPILILAVFISLLACSEKQADCTEIISERDMVHIVADVFLLENHIAGLRGPARETDSIIFMYAGLFQQHNVTPQKFEKALECYFLDKDRMNKMLDEVLNTLSIAQSKSSQPQDKMQQVE